MWIENSLESVSTLWVQEFLDRETYEEHNFSITCYVTSNENMSANIITGILHILDQDDNPLTKSGVQNVTIDIAMLKNTNKLVAVRA